MATLIALKANDETIIAGPKAAKAKGSNTSWSLGSDYLNRVAETAFTYSDSLEAVVTALKDAWEKGNRSVADIQHAYMIGAIVKYLRRASERARDGKITNDLVTQAEVILGKKNLTKLVKDPTDNHRTQVEQNYYQAAAMSFSRLKDKAGLPKDERGAQNHRKGKTTSDGTNSLSIKDLKLAKIETKVDGIAALTSIAALIYKLQENHPKAFNDTMLMHMAAFSEFVASLHPSKSEKE